MVKFIDETTVLISDPTTSETGTEAVNKSFAKFQSYSDFGSLMAGLIAGIEFELI